ncbi:MAG: hypothetical protein WCZ90_07085 [Melioribacteraceae bacterium]
MKTFLITSIIILTLVICILIPILFGSVYGQDINQSLSILSAISSFFTLIIALLLYNKLSIESTIVEKQTDAVINLLSAIRKVSLIFDREDHISSFTMHRESMKQIKNNPKVQNIPLLFSMSYFKAIKEVNDASYNIFLPRIIVNSSRQLVPSRIYQIEIETIVNEKYLKVETIESLSVDAVKKYGKVLGGDIQIQEFVKSWELLINDLEKWLKDNSSIKIELNI